MLLNAGKGVSKESLTCLDYWDVGHMRGLVSLPCWGSMNRVFGLFLGVPVKGRGVCTDIVMFRSLTGDNVPYRLAGPATASVALCLLRQDDCHITRVEGMAKDQSHAVGVFRDLLAALVCPVGPLSEAISSWARGCLWVGCHALPRVSFVDSDLVWIRVGCIDAPQSCWHGPCKVTPYLNKFCRCDLPGLHLYVCEEPSIAYSHDKLCSLRLLPRGDGCRSCGPEIRSEVDSASVSCPPPQGSGVPCMMPFGPQDILTKGCFSPESGVNVAPRPNSEPTQQIPSVSVLDIKILNHDEPFAVVNREILRARVFPVSLDADASSRPFNVPDDVAPNIASQHVLGKSELPLLEGQRHTRLCCPNAHLLSVTLLADNGACNTVQAVCPVRRLSAAIALPCDGHQSLHWATSPIVESLANCDLQRVWLPVAITNHCHTPMNRALHFPESKSHANLESAEPHAKYESLTLRSTICDGLHHQTKRLAPLVAVRVGEATHPGPQLDIRGYFQPSSIAQPPAHPVYASSSSGSSPMEHTFRLAVINPTAVQGREFLGHRMHLAPQFGDCGFLLLTVSLAIGLQLLVTCFCLLPELLEAFFNCNYAAVLLLKPSVCRACHIAAKTRRWPRIRARSGCRWLLRLPIGLPRIIVQPRFLW